MSNTHNTINESVTAQPTKPKAANQKYGQTAMGSLVSMAQNKYSTEKAMRDNEKAPAREVETETRTTTTVRDKKKEYYDNGPSFF